METQIIIIYCICDDIIKNLKMKEDIQVTMTNAEILTTAITAAEFFCGNHERARIFLKEYNYIPNMLSKSQFNRRLHAIPENVWQIISMILAKVFKQNNISKEYSVDSFPVSVCKNIRISNCKIYKKNEEYRGKCTSKREYFYGIRVHMIVTSSGGPVEFIIAPGSYHDSTIFKLFELDLPEGSTLYADAGFTDYEYEDLVNDSGINFLVTRKSNSKRPHKPSQEYLITHNRKIIETTFSKITALFPRVIHAVTKKGFELKVACFILAYSFNFLMVTT